MFDYIRRVEKKGKVMQSMLSELDPEVVAKQLCLYDFKLMKNIHPIEYLDQIWGCKDNEDTPCLNFFISRFNLVYRHIICFTEINIQQYFSTIFINIDKIYRKVIGLLQKY